MARRNPKKKGREMKGATPSSPAGGASSTDRRPPMGRTVSATPRGTKSPAESQLDDAGAAGPDQRRRPSLDHNKSLDRLQRMQIDLNKKRALARGSEVTDFAVEEEGRRRRRKGKIKRRRVMPKREQSDWRISRGRKM